MTFWLVVYAVLISAILLVTVSFVERMGELPLEIEEFKLKLFTESCERIAHKMVLDLYDEYKPSQYLTELDMAKEHYRYECLDEERPVDKSGEKLGKRR